MSIFVDVNRNTLAIILLLPALTIVPCRNSLSIEGLQKLWIRATDQTRLDERYYINVADGEDPFLLPLKRYAAHNYCKGKERGVE
jgi:hypothetical protein